ncbi:MAG: hypothetical protein HFJ10_00845 [Lachnospiraceae bacterium]|nr:hypothetical protein [Lachnospiraceae bacterium]
MNCGIALFIYDRPQCTKKVLESLKRNCIRELYVFQDGIGDKTNKTGWEQNVNLIENINWCEVHYKKNEQKASSLDKQIITGINRVFEQKEEIIVIEDDCIISNDTIAFFEKCFEIYRYNKRIISIDAYLEPIEVPEEYEMSVIASGAPSSWGWGTWKDRWLGFQKDFAIIKHIGDAMKYNKMFDTCGYPIKKILTDYSLLSTWDFWWSLYVLLKEGISIRPIYNKVYNIGFANPGTHTFGDSPWVVPISDKKNIEEDPPFQLEIEPWAEAGFKNFYQRVNEGKTLIERQTYYRGCLERWLELKQQGKNISDVLLKKNIDRVAVYGTGTIGKLLIQELVEKVTISYFIVTYKNANDFMGYSVYEYQEEQWRKETDRLTLIVIPGYDIDTIKQMVGKLFLKVYCVDELFDNI